MTKYKFIWISFVVTMSALCAIQYRSYREACRIYDEQEKIILENDLKISYHQGYNKGYMDAMDKVSNMLKEDK